MTDPYTAPTADDSLSTELVEAPGTGAPAAGLDLPSLIGSRLCHDLISPLGAIGNGIELLSLSDAGGEAEIALISDSVEHANARLRFFRVAFGIASAEQRLGSPETRSILAGITRTGRLSVDWLPNVDLPRNEVKLAFLGLMCIESALPQGGLVTIQHDEDGWKLVGQARRLRAEPALWEPLAAGRAPAELAPAQVQFALLPHTLAAVSRRRTHVEISEAEITLRF